MFVIAPLLTAFLSLGKPTRKRLYKVARAHWVPKFKRKSLAPNIIPEGFAKLEPRIKDWGPDGKLTQLWQDAFDYWQLEDPQGVFASFKKKEQKMKERKIDLETKAEIGEAVYADYISSRGSRFVSVHKAVDAQNQARAAREMLQDLVSDFDKRMLTPEERVAKRLSERYGAEVFYNNDLVRLSSQKQMPTFDYIALTSV